MAHMKILLSVAKADPKYQPMVDELQKLAEVEYVPLTGYSLQDVDVFVGKSLTEEELLEANKLKVVFAYKTGVENFPLAALAKKGITLCNSHADSKMIAQYALSLSSTLLSNIVSRDANLRKGNWQSSEWRSLYDCKVGLLGFGNIGKEIYRYLQMNKIPVVLLDRGYQAEASKAKDIYDLADKSDLIISSLPDTPETKGMLDKKFFSHLKGKYLIEIGRTSDLKWGDLYDALRNGMGGAAIDGFSFSPSNRNDILTLKEATGYDFESLDNVVLSPHCATQGANGRDNYVEDVQDNLLGYLHGKPLRNVVDLKKGY